MSDHAFIGRQPLFDASTRTAAYELIVRDGLDDTNPYGDRESAARRLLSGAVHHVGLDELIGGHDVWVPATLRLLHEGHHQVLPAKRTVLELTEADLRSAGAHDDLERVRHNGYRVALDLGPTLTERPDVFARTLVEELGATRGIQAIKLPACDCLERWASVTELARTRGITTVATGVDDHDAADLARTHFDLFQGAFLFQPVFGGLFERVDRLAAMQLIAELERPNVSFEDVEQIISRDASLSLRVLSLANSGLFSLPKRVDSVRSALLLLGLRNVRHMALMVTLTSVGDLPRELTLTALVRARQCELLARIAGHRAEVGFTVGLLSLISVFSGMATLEALAQLPITDDVRDAIAHHAGPYGWILAGAIAAETGALAAFLRDARDRPGLSMDELSGTYAEALQWAERLRSGTSAGP